MNYEKFLNPDERKDYEEIVEITLLLNDIKKESERAFDFAYAYISGYADGLANRPIGSS